MKFIIRIAIYLSAIVGFISVMVFATAAVSVAKSNNKYEKLQLFTKVLNMVDEYYVEKVDIDKLIYGGLKGMMATLDPHTNFLTPEVFKEFEKDTSGEFGGIGVEITLKDKVLTVISPIEDSPAWKAGVKAGDKIIAIGGVSTKGLNLAETAKLMMGKLGKIITLSIIRENENEIKKYRVKRSRVKLKPVKYYNLEGGYHYVRITSFIENTFSELDKYLKKAKKKKDKIKGLIVDLRKNPGGLLNQAVKVSDLFLEKGIIVSTIGRDKSKKEIIRAHKEGTMDQFPIVVIIDEHSASASEILSGALRDNKRALIVGRRSFGKGSVQSVVRLGDGSGVKITVARYYTPNGKSIQAEGITPDIVLESYSSSELARIRSKKKVLREADIQGHLENQRKPKKKGLIGWWNTAVDKAKLSASEKLIKDDYQVAEAFKYLKTWKVIKSYK